MHVLSHQQISAVSGGETPGVFQDIMDFYKRGDISNWTKCFTSMGACVTGSWVAQGICVVTAVAVCVPLACCAGILGLGIYGIYAASEE